MLFFNFSTSRSNIIIAQTLIRDVSTKTGRTYTQTSLQKQVVRVGNVDYMSYLLIMYFGVCLERCLSSNGPRCVLGTLSLSSVATFRAHSLRQCSIYFSLFLNITQFLLFVPKNGFLASLINRSSSSCIVVGYRSNSSLAFCDM